MCPPHTATLRTLLALTAILLAALACALGRPAAADAAGLRFGATSTTDPYGGDTRAIDVLQGRLQRRISIVHWYQSWGGGTWTAGVQPPMFNAVAASGRIPLMTWEPQDARASSTDQPGFQLQRIVAGEFDWYLGIWATQLRNLGRPVHLRPMHEFNGDWYPWAGTANANTPALYRQAWRHMHRLFDARGATNVRWVWAPNATDVPRTAANRLERYYPGRAYVDVLGIDGYNWGAGVPGHGGWQSFEDVFRDGYERLRRLGPQPIWVTETGSDDQGGSKAAWVRDMFAAARRMPRLRAIVWFDENKERDWRVDSSPAVARAFKKR